VACHESTGVTGIPYPYTTSALEGGWYSAPRPGRITPGERDQVLILRQRTEILFYGRLRLKRDDTRAETKFRRSREMDESI